MNTTPYPLDFDSLQKGNKITADVIAKITGKEPGSDEYQFARLALRQKIADEIEERRGETWTVKCEGLDLLILTDAEATEHNHSLVKQYTRGLHAAHYRMMGVDVKGLDAESRIKHERRLNQQGAVILALNKLPVRFAHAPVRRLLPGKVDV